MKIVKVKITIGSDRNYMVSALAHAGYKVWIENPRKPGGLTPYDRDHLVCFEVGEAEVINKEQEVIIDGKDKAED